MKTAKTIHLLRHAKSDWGDLALSDHDRPLNKRGITAAKAMGQRLAADAFQVDMVFCSTATRARETLALLGGRLRKTPTTFSDALYMISPEDLLAFIAKVPETAQSILLVGHNPTTHDVALSLTARAAPGQTKALAALKEKYPTGAMTTISFNVDQWRGIKPGTGTLKRFLKPRDLEDAPPAKKEPAKKKAAKKKA